MIPFVSCFSLSLSLSLSLSESLLIVFSFSRSTIIGFPEHWAPTSSPRNFVLRSLLRIHLQRKVWTPIWLWGFSHSCGPRPVDVRKGERAHIDSFTFIVSQPRFGVFNATRRSRQRFLILTFILNFSELDCRCRTIKLSRFPLKVGFNGTTACLRKTELFPKQRMRKGPSPALRIGPCYFVASHGFPLCGKNWSL